MNLHDLYDALPQESRLWKAMNVQCHFLEHFVCATASSSTSSTGSGTLSC